MPEYRKRHEFGGCRFVPMRRRADVVLGVLMAWHILLALSLIVGPPIVLSSLAAPDLIAVVLAIVALLVGVLSALAAVFIARRDHLGRTLSLTVNYLLCLGSALALAHLLGVFMGLDDLADAMARGIPYLLLLLVIIGYFISTVEVRERPVPAARRALGRVVMISGGVGFLLTAGALSALASSQQVCRRRLAALCSDLGYADRWLHALAHEPPRLRSDAGREERP